MTYDCFAFFNELDLLEIRLHELSPVVDKFVLVEATRTFQKASKPLYFQENKDRFKEFEDKIVHIVVDEYPNFFSKFRIPSVWDYDNHQKNQVARALKNCQPDDVIIISDIDEIPSADKITAYKNQPGIKVFEQYLFFYFLNYICTKIDDGNGTSIAQTNKKGFGWWRGPVMVNFRDFKSFKQTRKMQNEPDSKVTVIEEGGWHFSFQGGIPAIIKKIESWTHDEFNNDFYKNPERMEQLIQEGKSLFDNITAFKLLDLQNPEIMFPSYILQEQKKFSLLIKS